MGDSVKCRLYIKLNNDRHVLVAHWEQDFVLRTKSDRINAVAGHVVGLDDFLL